MKKIEVKIISLALLMVLAVTAIIVSSQTARKVSAFSGQQNTNQQNTNKGKKRNSNRNSNSMMNSNMDMNSNSGMNSNTTPPNTNGTPK